MSDTNAAWTMKTMPSRVLNGNSGLERGAAPELSAETESAIAGTKERR